MTKRTASGYRVTLEGKFMGCTFDWDRGEEEWPATNTLDSWGGETDIVEDVVVIVFSSGPDEWHTLDTRKCIVLVAS